MRLILLLLFVGVALATSEIDILCAMNPSSEACECFQRVFRTTDGVKHKDCVCDDVDGFVEDLFALDGLDESMDRNSYEQTLYSFCGTSRPVLRAAAESSIKLQFTVADVMDSLQSSGNCLRQPFSVLCQDTSHGKIVIIMNLIQFVCPGDSFTRTSNRNAIFQQIHDDRGVDVDRAYVNTQFDRLCP